MKEKQVLTENGKKQLVADQFADYPDVLMDTRNELASLHSSIGGACLVLRYRQHHLLLAERITRNTDRSLLGDMTNELEGGDHIVEFVSGGAKNYGYTTKKGKKECKNKGLRNTNDCKRV